MIYHILKFPSHILCITQDITNLFTHYTKSNFNCMIFSTQPQDNKRILTVYFVHNYDPILDILRL